MTEVLVSLLDDRGKLIDNVLFPLEKEHEYKTIGEIMVWLDCKLNYD